MRVILSLAILTAALLGASCTNATNVNSGSAGSNANRTAGAHNASAGTNHNMGGTGHIAVNQNSMNHNGMDHGNMNHSAMHSSPGAASAPYDLQFIDTMIHHHQGAVDMAKPAETKAASPELKEFARKIITDQNREIAQMKEWREKWYAGKPPATNMEMPGMKESMDMDMSKLQAASGKEFDLLFIEMMTPHHEGAVTMAQGALSKAEHPEIKTLAEAIIREQQKEIKQMQGWKNQWK